MEEVTCGRKTGEALVLCLYVEVKKKNYLLLFGVGLVF